MKGLEILAKVALALVPGVIGFLLFYYSGGWDMMLEAL